MKELAVIAVIMVVFVLGLVWIYSRDVLACQSKGGALVMGQCIRLEVIP